MDRHLGGKWPSDWGTGQLGYCHSPEKKDKGLAWGRGMRVEGKGLRPVEAGPAGLGRGFIEGQVTQDTQVSDREETGLLRKI